MPLPDNSHDVSDQLVTTESNDAPTDPAPADNPRPTKAETPSPSRWPRLGISRIVAGFRAPNVTERKASSNMEPAFSSSLQDRLAQLRFDTESAELEARKAAALEATATATRNLRLLSLESFDLENRSASHHSSRSASPPHQDPQATGGGSKRASRHPSRSASPQFQQMLSLIETQRQEMEAQRREDREERREERRAAQLREERRDAQYAQQLSAFCSRDRPLATYRIGEALEKFRMFEGEEDGAAYLAEIVQLLGTHQIPAEMWSRELFLKLKGRAAIWYTAQFKALASGEFPPWGELYAAILLDHSLLYQAAQAFQALHSATRQPGATGPEALQRIEELAMLLNRKGVRDPGPNEQRAYILQNQLTPDELRRWTALANADAAISDAALNELELHSPETCLGRHSCPPETRETFFAGRTEHLRHFLRDQSKATEGGRNAGSTPARAAALTSHDLPGTSPRSCAREPGQSKETTPREADSETASQCRVRVIRANRIEASTGHGQKNKVPLPPPEYMGPNSKHQIANEREFTKRKDRQVCFACTMDNVDYGQNHFDCLQHGGQATDQQRSDQTRRVVGAGVPRRN